jgi:hypothetical protein
MELSGDKKGDPIEAGRGIVGRMGLALEVMAGLGEERDDGHAGVASYNGDEFFFGIRISEF